MKFQHKYAEPKSDFSLMNKICLGVKSGLTVDHTSDLLTTILLGKFHFFSFMGSFE